MPVKNFRKKSGAGSFGLKFGWLKISKRKRNFFPTIKIFSQLKAAPEYFFINLGKIRFMNNEIF